MKKLLVFFCFISLFSLFLIPTKTFAGSFSYSNLAGDKIAISTTTTSATATISFSNNSNSLKDGNWNWEVCSNPLIPSALGPVPQGNCTDPASGSSYVGSGSIPINSLVQGTTYYFYIKPVIGLSQSYSFTTSGTATAAPSNAAPGILGNFSYTNGSDYKVVINTSATTAVANVMFLAGTNIYSWQWRNCSGDVNGNPITSTCTPFSSSQIINNGTTDNNSNITKVINLSSLIKGSSYSLCISTISEANHESSLVNTPPNDVSYYKFSTATTALSQSTSNFVSGTDYKWPLSYTVSNATFLGQILNQKGIDTDPKTTITLLYSDTDNTVSDTSVKSVIAIKDTSNAESYGFNTDGTYYFVLKNINNDGKTYYFKQDIFFLGTHNYSPVDSFNTTSGYTPANSAAGQTAKEQGTYTLLAPFPGLTAVLNTSVCQKQGGPGPNQICDINVYLNYMFMVLIGIGAVFLVIRLIFEGYRYMTSDVPFIKVNAKSGFFGALFGLLLTLSAYIILNTLNPQLVSNSIIIPTVQINGDGDTNTPTSFISSGFPSGIQCPKSGKGSNIAAIAQSFVGKVTYVYGGKNPSIQSDGTSHLDCSAFVSTVLNCAGYKPGTDFINGGTVAIFANAEKVSSTSAITNNSINGISLKPGDLVGWVAGGSEKYGHVLIYIGNGLIMDSNGGNNHAVGQAIGSRNLSSYSSLGNIEFVRRIPS